MPLIEQTIETAASMLAKQFPDTPVYVIGSGNKKMQRIKTPRPKAIWTNAFPEQLEKLSPKTQRLVKRIARRHVNRETAEHRRRRTRYNAQVETWLKYKQNHFCKVWELSADFRAEYIKTHGYPRKGMRATQCHHKRGKINTKHGDLLFLVSEWCPVSAAGHAWIDANREKARALGLLCPKGQFNSWPKELINFQENNR